MFRSMFFLLRLIEAFKNIWSTFMNASAFLLFDCDIHHSITNTHFVNFVFFFLSYVAAAQLRLPSANDDAIYGKKKSELCGFETTAEKRNIATNLFFKERNCLRVNCDIEKHSVDVELTMLANDFTWCCRCGDLNLPLSREPNISRTWFIAFPNLDSPVALWSQLKQWTKELNSSSDEIRVSSAVFEEAIEAQWNRKIIWYRSSTSLRFYHVPSSSLDRSF